MIHIDFTLSYLQLYLIIINIFAFIFYGYDKAQAIKTSQNISRVSENKLLLSSFVGGSIGSLFAMFLFRHKIKKPSFMIKYLLVVIVQIIVAFVYYNQHLLLENL